MNRISGGTNAIFNIIFILLALVCIIPVFFVFMISVSSEESIAQNGYRFIPEVFSLDAYKFLGREISMIVDALGVSVIVTAVGTVLGVALTTLMGYVISRRSYKLNNFFTMLVFIPMVFNGGMISSYVVNTQFMHLKDTMWALILPLCVSSFNVVICKTFLERIYRSLLLSPPRLMALHSSRFSERLLCHCQNRCWQQSLCSLHLVIGMTGSSHLCILLIHLCILYRHCWITSKEICRLC